MAFTCKGCDVCPSCNGRHLAQTAADHAFSPVPVRQWMISVPKRLRGLLADRPAAVRAVTKIFLAEIERLLCATACGTIEDDSPAVTVAAAAVGVSLASVLALSERRAAFVLSVTHELRTPLTTFRLYSGLLEEGMVATAEVPAYPATLRREADRLAHLVENVLAYARLERGRHAARRRPISVDALLDQGTPRPAERATQAGFAWRLYTDDAPRRLVVTTNPAAVEQVLFNLVDNACKYARATKPAVIAVTATPRGRSLAIAVRDHGPGVTAREAARLFEPFRKSARDAAEGAAGVGLGLALSRRLARQMGGDLVYESPADGGSRFVLTLPTAACVVRGVHQ